MTQRFVQRLYFGKIGAAVLLSLLTALTVTLVLRRRNAVPRFATAATATFQSIYVAGITIEGIFFLRRLSDCPWRPHTLDT